jgi:trimeric autotransporter adhesin
VTTDENGEAAVALPDYFEALNSDFRYQLTVIGTFAQAIIAQRIKDNRFVIRTSAPNVEVCWQVTGIRRDAWANKNRIRVEEEKPGRERGHYLHPEAFNQSEERGLEWARSPELMQQMKESRSTEKAKLRRQ